MKKEINEPDFIGGQGPLTEEEEITLANISLRRKKSEIKKIIQL